MRRFEYIKPTSVQEAVKILADHPDDAMVMAGGTALVVMIDQGILRPDYVVDLGGLSDLQGQDSSNGNLHLGALTTVRTLERDPQVKDRFGVLAEAASQVASVRIRNVATLGGTVSYGEPQTDIPAALIALNATATAVGTEGSREVAVEDFFLGPYETVLEPGEIVTKVSVPAPAPGTGGCHMKFTIGSPENKPVANASVLLRLDSSGICEEVRIVMGAVGPVPLLATDAAAILKGDVLNETAFAAAAAKAAEESDPVDDLRGPAWYKRRIIRVLVERGLTWALSRATAQSQ
jgi:carbon-monoxide dehydrogenase medium subunit